MSSSERRAQVEPLPALLAVAVFAIGLSLYGTTIAEVPLGSEPSISDATMQTVRAHLTTGPVVVPERMDRLDATLSEEYRVVLRADGRTWRWGPRIEDPKASRRTHVLVRTDRGELPGVLRVES